jgi:hypothetical protein
MITLTPHRTLNVGSVHQYMPNTNQQNFVQTYQPPQVQLSTFNLSQPHINASYTPLYSSQNPRQFLAPVQDSISYVCAVQSTDNPGIFVFQCTFPRCRKKSFTRWYDFNRHYNGTHAAEKTVFWCPILDCNRSEGEGNRPFPRKDKMTSHALKLHGFEDGGWEGPYPWGSCVVTEGKLRHPVN